MMRLMTLVPAVLLLPFASTTSALSVLSVAPSHPHLLLKPLIGGPPWLKVHVQVCVTDMLACDFVPLDATSDSTLGKLITLQGVPGKIRIMGASKEEGNFNIRERRAIDYCEAFTNRKLHLLSNNCWTFALGLLWHLQQDQHHRDS